MIPNEHLEKKMAIASTAMTSFIERGFSLIMQTVERISDL